MGGWDEFNDRAAEKPMRDRDHHNDSKHEAAYNHCREHAKGDGGGAVKAIVVMLMAIDYTLSRIARALEAPRKCPGPIGTRVTITDKEGHPVNLSINVDPALNDILINTNPTNTDGTPREANLLFATSAPSVVALEIAPDNKSAKGRVLATGVCTVTINDGFSTDEVQVISAGSPPPTPGPIGTTVTLIAKGA